MKQTISIFIKIYYLFEKEYISTNNITFEEIDKVVELLNINNKKGIFVNDRGYDNNLL